MPIEAELHDGRILEFPDNTPPEVIQRTVKAQLGGADNAPPSVLEDVAKSAAFNGVPSGIAGILGAPADLYNLAGQAGDYVGGKLRQLAGKPELTDERKAELGVGSRVPLGSPDINKAVQSVTGQYYQPQTTPGEYARTATEFAVGAAPGGMRSAITSGFGGLTSEGAGQAFEGSKAEPYARLAGAVLGTTAANVPGMMRSTPGDMIAKRTQDITPEQWDMAEALQKQSQQTGIPLAGPEAIDSRALQQLAGDTAASAGGGPTMNKFFDARNPAVQQAVGNQLDNVGPAVNPQDVYTRATTGGSNVIKAAEAVRSAESGPFYKSAATQAVPEGDVASVISKIDEAIAAAPQGMDTELKKLRLALTDRITEKPVTNIGTLDTARKTFRDRAQLPDMNANALDKTVAAQVNPALDDLRNVLTRNNADFAQGRALYEQLSPPVDALKKGNIGELSRANTLDSVLKTVTNPKTARPESIRETLGKLATTDATLPRDITRTHLENAFDTAAKDIQTGPNRMIGANFRNSIMGTPQQRANMKAMFQATAEAQGLPKDDLWNGFNRTMDVLERTGRIPGVGSPTASRGISNAEAASGGILNNTIGNLNPTGGGIGARVGAWWRDTVQRKNYSKLAEVFTSPDSIAEMRKLAKLDPYSPKAQAIVANILGIARESQKEHQQ